MKKQIISLVAFTLFQALSFAQQEAKTNEGKTVLLYENGTWLYADSVSILSINATTIIGLQIPAVNSNDEIISHSGFSFLYNETHEQANWIAYELTKEETEKLFERTDKFLPDPKVISGTATNKDYEGSGYDRGHLAPAADMVWSQMSMAESFYYSNMSPQVPAFNRGIWKYLEEQVRNWAIEYSSVYVVTGPVLKEGLPTIGPNKVTVPEFYYKVILDYTNPEVKGIGFIMPNKGSKDSLTVYAVSIDSVEKITAIDFFSKLPDDQEKIIEKTLCINCWLWGNSKTPIKVNEINTGESVQCKGLTRAGARCKNKTSNPKGFCHLHD